MSSEVAARMLLGRLPATDAEAGSSPSYEQFQRTKTFGSLDGLRAFSILAVVWHHSVSRPVLGLRMTGRGFLGVDLFFVISGFLIVTLLLRERRRSGRISLRSFYVRRFLRIFPPYYALLLLVAVVAYLLPGATSAALRHELPLAACYVSNLFPLTSLLAITWSLSTEEQFYLIAPAVEKYAGRAVPWLLPAAYVLVTLPTFGLLPGIALPAFFRETTFGPILLGVMLAHALDDPRGYARISRLLCRRWMPVVSLGLVLLAASHPAPDISGWPRIGIHLAMLVLLASCVVAERHSLAPLLSLWPLRRIGAVSYGIYLFHKVVQHFLDKAWTRMGMSSELIACAALTLATWAVAELSYRHFESRFLALKGRFSA